MRTTTHEKPGPGTPFRIVCLILCGIAAGLWPPLGAAADADRLAALRKGFEAALERLDTQYAHLNEAYKTAVGRLQESTTRAGHLEGALAAKEALETFANTARFDPVAFEKALSGIPELKRLQTTYLDQRRVIDRNLEPSRRELSLRYDQELGKLQVEMTKIGNLESALHTKRTQEAFRTEPAFAKFFNVAIERSKILQGKLKFVTKGEIELYLNGKVLGYRNDYAGPDAEVRITGETRGAEDFLAGDVLIIRARSYANFRGVILGILAENKAGWIPIRGETLRYLGIGKDPAKIGAEDVEKAATGGISRGGTDPIMLAEWDKLKLPGTEQGGSDWILSESPNQWHTWGVLLQPEMVLPLAGQN